MEESIGSPWLEDMRGFARMGMEDHLYSFSSAGQEALRASVDFSNPEAYAYFADPYVQPTMAFKGAQDYSSCREIPEWPGEIDLPAEPLHQLPGWTQGGSSSYPDWQQQQPRSETSSQEPTWMVEMPPSLYPPPLEIPQFFHPGNGFADEQPQQRSPSPASSNGLVAASRKATARKNRILLRQKSAPHQRGGSHVNGSASSPRPSLKKTLSNKIPQELLMNSHVQGRDMDPLRFVLHKVLQPSDVNNLGRIVISKKEAEAHLPYLSLKEGIFITMEDFDTSDLWTFRYRFWPNIKSRMYLLESTGDFIRAHHLKKGDIVILWRNNLRGTYVIQAMVALPNSTGCGSSTNTTTTPTDSYRPAGSDIMEEEDPDMKGKTKARRG